MNDKKTYIMGLAVVAFLGLTIFLVGQNGPDASGTPDVDVSSSDEVMRTEDGTKYTVAPSELRQGCPSMDCIPSIDNPKYQSAGQADWLEPDDLVIGVEGGNESRAFPLRILNKHEIVNTEINGEPIVVTYCPLCRSGVTYSREINGETLEFGVSGKLRDANLVMYDRQTETYWSQIGGNAIIGPRVPQQLELRYSSITEWSEWREGHPETQVLSRDTGIYSESAYDTNPYSRYADSGRVGFGVDQVDDRLGSKELVHGIEVENASKAYTDRSLEQGELIQDEIGGEPIMVMKRPDDGSVIAFSREVNEETLNFSIADNGLTDSNGDRWRFNGEKVDGDERLDVLTPQGFYWFAWSKFHPETEIYDE